MTISGGAVREFVAEPKMPPMPNRVPLTEAHRRGVTDPMTASLFRVPGNGSLFTPEACPRKLAIFDGRMRYDLHLTFKRIEQVKAEKGYQGNAVVCSVIFSPIAGHVSGPRRDPVSRQPARDRGGAGADRRHPGAGALPDHGPDADRNRRHAGDAVRLDAAACQAERIGQSAVAVSRGRPEINAAASPKYLRDSVEYTMWWQFEGDAPDMAVNEAIQVASQRFGRVSFETRSTA